MEDEGIQTTDLSIIGTRLMSVELSHVGRYNENLSYSPRLFFYNLTKINRKTLAKERVGYRTRGNRGVGAVCKICKFATKL